MDTDDIAPPPSPGDPLALAARQDLTPYSVAELNARLTMLQTEIARTSAKRDEAVRHRASADNIFRR